ncbi:putative zinc finger protein [Orchesella cincta]|uniref:Putative zinc finger protein n=1 Tax=Orchesella cincta TaxID=48709 RepID=A0A1D2M149_ORCCI|nr:putative zinc finger protein [Orchesella cincta]
MLSYGKREESQDRKSCFCIVFWEYYLFTIKLNKLLNDIMIKCLFCASNCQIEINKCIKTEVFITPDDDDGDSFETEPSHPAGDPNVLLFGGENPTIQKNLRGFFILTRILQFSEETLSQLIARNGGQFDPQSWSNVCQSCGMFLHRFQETLVQISKLERSLREIGDELKARIETSQDNYDELEDSSDWRWIRGEVLGYHSTQSFDDEPSFEVPVIIDTRSISVFRDEFSVEFDSQSDQFEEDFEIRLEPVENYQESNIPEQNFPSSSSSFLTENYDLPLAAPQQKTTAHLFNCLQCPYGCDKRVRLNAHLTLHEEGSGGVACEDCGCYYHYKSLAFHRTSVHKLKKSEAAPIKKMKRPRSLVPNSKRVNFHHKQNNGGHPTLHQRTKSKKKQSFITSRHLHRDNGGEKVSMNMDVTFYNENGNEDESQEEQTSSTLPLHGPTHSSVRARGSYRHNCDQCPYGASKKDRMEAHLKVHSNGSNFIICGECGVFVLPTKMKHHQNLAHYSNPRASFAKKQSKRQAVGRMKDVGGPNETDMEG